MKTQEQFLEEILNLKKERPDLDIHFCIDSEELAECSWTAHKIYSVSINSWYQDDERIYTDDGEILDLFADEIDNAENLTDEEIEKIIHERYDKEVKLAICVFTNAG